MSFFLLGLVATASAASPSLTLLVFEFPDGARGGVGKIDGTLRPFVKTSEVDLLRGCGLKDVSSHLQVTHRLYISGRSSPTDVAVVRCFQHRTSRHFNVGRGYAVPALGGLPAIVDEKPFRQFWRQLQKKN